jgi:starch synthase
MKVVLATSEAIPYVKTGGLADVSGTLANELRALGVKASLMLPLYRGLRSRFKLEDTGCSVEVSLGSKRYGSRIFVHEDSTYFVECDDFFNRQELYGTSSGDYEDNDLRFIFFSKAVLEACSALGLKPDVLHTNDWQTALVPLYMKTLYKKGYRKTASIFTIHNMGYQGIFPASAMALTGLGKEWFTPSGIEFFDQVNFLKAGIIGADVITTVSDNYSRQILTKEYGAGLEGVLGERKKDIVGILNGIDYEEWDPSSDRTIPARYKLESLAGKKRCKRALLKECGLRGERAPLAGIVGRLSSQKGVDVFLEAVDEIVDAGLNVAVLGQGEDVLQKGLRVASKRHSGRLFVKTGFDEEFARRIYAGSDLLLMPSHYEPCGLVQMIAMRYGAVPIARATGGLVDTIADYDHLKERGTGFLFTGRWPSALAECAKRAICVYKNGEQWKSLVGACMKQRFSWKSSARKYVSLYRKLKRKVAA